MYKKGGTTAERSDALKKKKKEKQVSVFFFFVIVQLSWLAWLFFFFQGVSLLICLPRYLTELLMGKSDNEKEKVLFLNYTFHLDLLLLCFPTQHHFLFFCCCLFMSFLLVHSYQIFFD